jgi:hypothetical protein
MQIDLSDEQFNKAFFSIRCNFEAALKAAVNRWQYTKREFLMSTAVLAYCGAVFAPICDKRLIFNGEWGNSSNISKAWILHVG